MLWLLAKQKVGVCVSLSPWHDRITLLLKPVRVGMSHVKIHRIRCFWLFKRQRFSQGTVCHTGRTLGFDGIRTWREMHNTTPNAREVVFPLWVCRYLTGRFISSPVQKNTPLPHPCCSSVPLFHLLFSINRALWYSVAVLHRPESCVFLLNAVVLLLAVFF